MSAVSAGLTVRYCCWRWHALCDRARGARPARSRSRARSAQQAVQRQLERWKRGEHFWLGRFLRHAPALVWATSAEPCACGPSLPLPSAAQAAVK
eukprot:scaffold633_cov134-Isochrysis_galbana.AAC.3